jgi:hypothetical protein
LQCARRMTWKRRHPVVKCLEGEYASGIRVAANEMKLYEARLPVSVLKVGGIFVHKEDIGDR